MIVLTVDHDSPATFARIIMPSARVSIIMFSAIDTGTLASAAIDALASSNLPRLGKRRHLKFVEPAVLVQRLDQRVGDRGVPGDRRAPSAPPRRFACTAVGTSRACCGLAASSRCRTCRRPWRSVSDKDGAACVGRMPRHVASCRSPSARSDQPGKAAFGEFRARIVDGATGPPHHCRAAPARR